MQFLWRNSPGCFRIGKALDRIDRDKLLYSWETWQNTDSKLIKTLNSISSVQMVQGWKKSNFLNQWKKCEKNWWPIHAYALLGEGKDLCLITFLNMYSFKSTRTFIKIYVTFLHASMYLVILRLLTKEKKNNKYKWSLNKNLICK